MNTGYGINVRDRITKMWLRFATKSTIEEALTIANQIAIDNELWNIIEIEKITEKENGDFDYHPIKYIPCGNGIYDELCRETLKDFYNKTYKDCISTIDMNGSGAIDCLLKLGYYSDYTGEGYFLSSSFEEFQEKITSIHPISDMKNIEELKDYLIWLSDFPELFKSELTEASLRELQQILVAEETQNK